jgi:hypothetical protein
MILKEKQIQRNRIKNEFMRYKHMSNEKSKKHNQLLYTKFPYVSWFLSELSIMCF